MAIGGRDLLPPVPLRPPSLAGWDAVLLSPQPGRSSIYAFARGDGASRQDLAERIEQLAGGIVRSGQIAGAPGLRLIAVLVFERGIPGGRARPYTHLSPATYYAQLRPSTWVVDLQEHRVIAARRWDSEGMDVLRQALTGGVSAEVDEASVATLQRQHEERLRAFYQLMRGRQPWVTWSLIAVNVALFLLVFRGGTEVGPDTLNNFGALTPSLVEHGEWWRLFTAIFLHASVAHILFNMTSLFAIGVLAERLYGSLKFLAIYLGSGLIGSFVSFAYAAINGSDLANPHVGASGAIFGIAGALLTIRFQRTEVIPRRVRDQISGWLFALIAINLGISFVTPFVDNSAHLGGLIGGALLSFVFPLVRDVSKVG
jgi:membrane associated rhomboid family serine protease